MKERYRRIPIVLIISPAYEERTPDARLVLLSLIISPRQTPPGVFDGGMKALKYETALPAKRLKAALMELEGAGMIVAVSSGGWWVRDTFRAQCCNEDYAKSAINYILNKYPETLPAFLKENRSYLGKYPAISKAIASSDPPQTGDTPHIDPPQSPTGSGSKAVTGTDTGSGAGAAPKPHPATRSGSDSGGRNTGKVGSADTRDAPIVGASASASPQDAENCNGKGAERREIPSGFLNFVSGLSRLKREFLLNAISYSGNIEGKLSPLKTVGFSPMELDMAKKLLEVKRDK